MKEVRLPADAATICFVTNAQIQKWNAVYRGKNKATDVLSFPNDEATAPANGAGAEKKTTRKASPTKSVTR